MTICLVSSIGGHLTEIHALAPAYEGHSFFYVLNSPIDCPNEMIGKTYFISHSERDLKFILNLWEAWRILRKERADLILSTGAGPAVCFSLVGKLLGIRSIYIENMARVYSPSLTGKIMYYIADRFFYQWRPLAAHFPNGIYGGPLL